MNTIKHRIDTVVCTRKNKGAKTIDKIIVEKYRRQSNNSKKKDKTNNKLFFSHVIYIRRIIDSRLRPL